MIRRSRRYRGFTLVEMMIVTAMSALLMMMIAGFWSSLAPSMVDSLAQAKVAQEAHFALEILKRDHGGYLPGGEMDPDDVNKQVGRTVTGDSRLLLCFDGGSTPNGVADWSVPDTVIEYRVVDEQLLRIDRSTGGQFVAANFVTNFELTDRTDGTDIELTLTNRDFTRTYKLVTRDP